jgi:hypothetical protein
VNLKSRQMNLSFGTDCSGRENNTGSCMPPKMTYSKLATRSHGQISSSPTLASARVDDGGSTTVA